ncbi:outer membrane beta-barrel protein [Mesorhizobium sp. ZMM04-4]
MGILQALILTASAAGLSMPAQAQDAGGLRGGIGLEDADQGGASGSGGIAPPYVPISPGALTDPADDDATAFSGDATTSARTTATVASPTATETDDTTTGTVRQPAVDSVENQPLNEGTQRAQAIEGLDRPTDDDPYEALGIRWGSFILKPTLESGVTATSNADSSADGSEAVLSETTLRLNATSDWTSHSASVDAYGTFRKTLSGEEIEDVEGGVDAQMELELGKDYRATGTFTYSLAPESAASPVVIPGTVDEPYAQTVGGTLGLEKAIGKTRFGVTGGVSNESYGDADLLGGGTLSQKDRNATLYTLALRAGYEISPALTPFVEAEIGRNQYQQDVDAAGYRRSSDQYAVRGGLELDLGEKLSGEVSAGWITEEFDDARLESLSTPTVAAELNWSPVRGTDVQLSGSTALEGTTTPGESGSVLYSTSLSVERAMRANLTGDAMVGLGYRNYSQSDGYDFIFNAEASLTWWLNRYTGLVGRVEHETVTSNLPDRESETNSVFLGLKLQR